MAEAVEITFCGGTQGPTGSNFLLTDLPRTTNILVDCGLFQGSRMCEDINREPFPYDPRSIDFLFVTHAHIDHIGRIPRLMREGFKGKIVSTAPTKDISELMLKDSLGVLEKEAKRDGKPLLYTEEDVARAVSLWETVPYREETKAGPFTVRLSDAGHILGSAIIEFTIDGHRLSFTGDLGNTPAPLLSDTESVRGSEVLVLESVYGDRNHEEREVRKHLLEDVVEDTMRAGGALLVPAFSLERTQELLFELNDLVENGRIPEVPVFIDSPLAIDVTKIYEKYTEFFNTEAQDIIKSGDDIFRFHGLKFTYTREESMDIWSVPNPKVIIAGSGMSNGGRIVHHEKKYLPDEKSTLLIVGYQVPGSLGRTLQEGARIVNILGDEIRVRARVETIHGYSAHKDSERLFEFVADAADSLKDVYVVLGEPRASSFLAQRIRDYLGVRAIVPSRGETVRYVLQ